MPHDIEVLDANSAFYRAFSARDLGAMDSLWSRRSPVVCVHPGWDVLRGRDEVMDSWRAILSGAEAPKIGCSHAFAQVHGELAIVVCREHLPGGQLVATNVFALEDGRWRLVHHQASPLATDENDNEDFDPEQLN
jgi:ketosteroid isomerase-like protein